jgi:hypothetical protein
MDMAVGAEQPARKNRTDIEAVAGIAKVIAAGTDTGCSATARIATR